MDELTQKRQTEADRTYLRICLLAALIVLMTLFAYVGRGHASKIGDGFNGQSFTPTLAYNSEPAFTPWNNGWLAGAIAMYGVGDVTTTIIGLNNGFEEGNPLFGSHPSPYLLVAAKVVILGVAWWFTEYYTPPGDRQRIRNYVYAPLAIIGAGVTGLNINTMAR